MFLNFRVFLISCCLICLSTNSFAQGASSNQRENQDEFIPITTDAYTDSLYFQNLEKSRAEETRLNNPPIIEVLSPIGIEERIHNYEVIRDGYSKNSKEYLDVQHKIDRLINELNTKEPNE